jgi:hypothetical protein
MLMKPRNMAIEAFRNRVKVMVHYITDIPFPGPDPSMVTTTRLKNIIFQAMSAAWQTSFLQVNGISATTMLQLQQFMSQEWEFAETCNVHPKPSTHENPCRLHSGTHPWSKCHQNPNSHNYQGHQQSGHFNQGNCY